MIYAVTEISVWAEPIPSQLFPDSQQAAMIELKTLNSAAADPGQIWDSRKNPMGLYAQVTQGRRPVYKSSVYAHVYTSDLDGYSSSLLTSIPLLDEGIAGYYIIPTTLYSYRIFVIYIFISLYETTDVTSGDGIYSGYLTTISDASWIYSVRYEIRNNGTAQIDTGSHF